MRTKQLLLCAALLLAVPLAGQSLPGLTDAGVHPPPSSGPFAFASWRGPVLGTAVADPVFGAPIHRITNDGAFDDLYGRNAWWNADGTLYYHSGKLLDAVTGALRYTVPVGAFSYDAGFDPVDPKVVYYVSGSAVHKVTLGAGTAISDTVWLTVPSAIKSQGGSMNWISADGGLIAVAYGTEPSVHVFDTANLAAGPFTGAASRGSSTGYAAMLPSGHHLVTTAGAGYQGNGATTTFSSFAIDRVGRTVGAAHAFWNLCGDHGAYSSPSDGHDYLITTSCYNSNNVMRVDVTGAVGTESAQISANKILLPNLSWSFSTHETVVAAGALRDWAFIDTEGGSNASWTPYQNEIIGFNVLTGETRRLAHHASSLNSYTAQPRVSASWRGEWIGFASDFQSGPVNVFALAFGSGGPVIPPPPPPPPPVDTTAPVVTFTAPAAGASVTVNTAATITVTATDDVGVASQALTANGVSITSPATFTLLGSVTLVATATDAAGNVGSATRTLTVIAAPPPPPPDQPCVAGPWTIQTQGARSVTLVRSILIPASGAGRACGVLTTTITTPR